MVLQGEATVRGLALLRAPQFAKPIKTPKALIRRLAPRVSGIMLVRPPLSLNLADTEINRRSMTIYSREYMWSVAHILTTVRIYFYN